MGDSPNDREKPPDDAFGHLRTTKSSLRLNQIEKIRANGVGELVALPQLVVCGDQSAGKSSVLEGITRIPFPRQEGLCTRFPTEIILRHTSDDSTTIVASIRPHASRSEQSQEPLLSFRKVVQDMAQLPSITHEVSKLMNIRGYTEQSDGISFAPDALRIEISGPTGLHLSVVDLPGLISVTNDEQNEEDVDAVYDMVNTYLQSSRTIILAVLQASNDMANQGIIKLARKHDPDGQRTVGIITKPDLINEGAEHRIALVARNEDSIKLKLGFFLLKNPSPLELEDGISAETRSRRELQFFASPAWKNQGVDMGRVGADRLRMFLQNLLDAHIERELPKVLQEIKNTLAAKEKGLQALGSARPTVGHVRTFLTGLSMEFYQLMDAALRGNYDSVNPEFFSNNNYCRLRARTQELNTAFATEMRLHGQKRKLSTPSPPSNSDDEATDETTQLIVSRAEMLQWVKEWVEHATKTVFLEDHLRREVSKVLASTLEEAKESAIAELDRLLRDERQSPLTYNHYYTDNVQKARLDEQKAAVRSAIALVTQEDHHGRLHISNHADDIERFITAIQSRITFNMDESACKEALTQLEAYYKKVAMKTFVDNMARQVIERHIMSPLPEAFGPRSVSSLSNEELWRIGSEPQAQSVRRSKLQTEVEDLSKSILDLQAVF
ncbi:hypothetical protein LLEC1_06517 [Akanthomyces lecanii]|uniref:GED domain-containing protein n=1 Tax=Cordyceps confragosa TaxID=2714763 RepID=A0A179ILH8_CORDF|nr:hypothetical protein LLEC1_06517 [Akanthomyces lecanii]